MKCATYLITALLMVGMFFVSASWYAILAEIRLYSIAVYLAKCIVGLPEYETW